MGWFKLVGSRLLKNSEQGVVWGHASLFWPPARYYYCDPTGMSIAPHGITRSLKRPRNSLSCMSASCNLEAQLSSLEQPHRILLHQEDPQYCTYQEHSPRLTKVMSSLHSSSVSSANAPSNVAKQDAPAIGYPRLADFMSKTPETQIFRSFSQLNILNILRLQAELHDLDRRLTEMQNLGPNIDHNTHFSTMRSDKTGDEESQASLLEEIDRKLERYSWSSEFAANI
jgi:hypothetical protein